MISSICSTSSTNEKDQEKPQTRNAPRARKQAAEPHDTVHLSPEAQAMADVDHDGDSQ
jgi:hypothetical protein